MWFHIPIASIFPEIFWSFNLKIFWQAHRRHTLQFWSVLQPLDPIDPLHVHFILLFHFIHFNQLIHLFQLKHFIHFIQYYPDDEHIMSLIVFVRDASSPIIWYYNSCNRSWLLSTQSLSTFVLALDSSIHNVCQHLFIVDLDSSIPNYCQQIYLFLTFPSPGNYWRGPTPLCAVNVEPGDFFITSKLYTNTHNINLARLKDNAYVGV